MDSNQQDALNNKLAWIVAEKSWRRLHYVEGVTADTWEYWWDTLNHEVTAICGATFQATLPGMFSRMGLTRCARCCKALDIPSGKGAPINDTSLDQRRVNDSYP